MTKKSNILVISHSGETGGAELALLDMLDYLVTQIKIKPYFIIPWDHGGLDAEIVKRGWEYTVIPYSVWALSKPLKYIEDKYREDQKNIQAIQSIIKQIDKINPTLVWSNSIVCPWGAIAAAQRRVHHIWYVHEFGDVGLNLKFEQGRQKSWSDVGWLSDMVIANSLTIKEHLIKYISKSKVQVAYIPYNTNNINTLSNQKINNVYSGNDDLKLILLGRVVSTKGQLDAIKAVGELKKRDIRVELCIVGSMKHSLSYSKTIKSTIKQLGIKDRVIIVDHTSNPFPYIKVADVGLTCSQHEAFGRTTFEYIILNKAVIATIDTGATKELVKSNFNGLGYNFGDYMSLANCIEIYANDKVILENHSNNSKTIVEEILYGSNSAKHLGGLISKLLSKPAEQKLPNITEKLINFSKISKNYKNFHKYKNESSKDKLRKIYYSKAFKPAKPIIKPLVEFQKSRKKR